MSASQGQNESQEGNQQFIHEDEEKKESYSTPQFPQQQQQHNISSIPSQTHSHSHMNINNTNHSHSHSSSSSIRTYIRSISDQSIPIQSNIHKYHNISQFTLNLCVHFGKICILNHHHHHHHHHHHLLILPYHLSF